MNVLDRALLAGLTVELDQPLQELRDLRRLGVDGFQNLRPIVPAVIVVNITSLLVWLKPDTTVVPLRT